MARRPLPSFSRILLYPNAPHLPLPHPFVQKHLENKIPENPILLSVNGGYSWRLRIEKVGENYCFADGWDNVVEDSHLEFGDFLVFWLIDQSTFKLSIYSPSGCQKDFPVETDDVNDDEEEEEEEELAEIKVGEKDEEEAEEDDDYNEFEKDEDEEEEFEEEEEEEEDEVEYDDDGEEDDDGDEDDDGGGDVDGDDGDPFFMAVISKSHERSMRLPLEFTRLAGIDSARRVTVKNMEGNEWKMKLLSHSRHYASNKSDNYAGKNHTRFYLSEGWSEFKRVNELCEGDECVFTFIRSEGKLCLARVTKKRVPAKPPAGKAPVAEVLKRPREETPREEVVEKKARPEKPAGKAPVTEVLKRLRRRPPREDVAEKNARSKNASGKAPVSEVLKRPKGRPPRVEKKARLKKPTEKVAAAEVLKRTRGRPPPEEVVEKKGRGRKPAGKAPTAQVLEVESKDEGAKRSRGRPFKRKRGRPAAVAHVK